MKCKECGSGYEKWIPEEATENNLCEDCNGAKWAEGGTGHRRPDDKSLNQPIKEGE